MTRTARQSFKVLIHEDERKELEELRLKNRDNEFKLVEMEQELNKAKRKMTLEKQTVKQYADQIKPNQLSTLRSNSIEK